MNHPLVRAAGGLLPHYSARASGEKRQARPLDGEPKRRNRLMARKRRRGCWLGCFAVVWGLVGVPLAEARLLNLGGSLGVTYNRSTTFSDTQGFRSRTAVHSIGQRYSLGAFGDFYLLGSYTLNFSLVEQLTVLENVNQETRYRIKDYRGSVHLFPKWMPVNLTRQTSKRRTDLKSASVGFTTRDRIDTLGANMVMNFRRIPRTVLNYRQSKLQADAL